MQSYLLVDPTSQLIQLLPLDCLLDPRFFNMYITFVKSVKMNVLICEWSKSVTGIVHGQRHNRQKYNHIERFLEQRLCGHVI